MADAFAKLKKDLLFHEKRLQLLLGTRVVDDLASCLAEKTQVRSECTADCRDARVKFERAASEPKLSGRWDELKVANLFRLEVPLRFVVGSVKFEAPETQDTDQLAQLIVKLDEIGQRYPEFQHAGAKEDTNAFVGMVRNVKFTGRDVTRMREAVSSKLHVIEELDDLTAVLQDSGFALTKLRSEVETCRQQDEAARAAGEVALSEEAIRRKLALLEKVIDTTFFQVHTIEATMETNGSRRQSNIAVFQSSAAMLECVRSEKRELSQTCVADLGRIARGMDFEAGAKDTGRGRVLELQKQSAAKISTLESRQDQLSARLKALFIEFSEVEQALHDVGVERAEAIAAHVALVEGSRHATSDFMELAKYADMYSENLRSTKSQYDDGIHAIQLLEKVLLQQHEFATYDFNASGHRLQAMRRRVCQELNVALNDLASGVGELVQRREAQLRSIGECLEAATCEMEMRKELLDPMAKRHVLRVRELEAARDTLESEIAELLQLLERQRSQCYEVIRKHLAEEEVTDVTHAVQTRALQSREALADLRQSLADARQGGNDLALITAQSELVRDAQTGAPVALPPKSAVGSSEASSRSVVVASMKQRSSRVTAVRDEIARFMDAPISRRSTPATDSGDAKGRSPPRATNDYAAALAAEEALVAEQQRRAEAEAAEEERRQQSLLAARRPVRVIGAGPAAAADAATPPPL